jgi:hypothetical protein
MSRRHAIFNAGYHAAVPEFYFLRTEPNSDLGADESEFLIGVHGKPEFSFLKDVELANEFGKKFNLSVELASEDRRGYLQWYSEFEGKFGEIFPMSRIDHYYFLFSKKLVELSSRAWRYADLCRLQSNFNTRNYLPRISLCAHEGEVTLYRLMAPSALLGSEAGHFYFNGLYKELKEEYGKIKSASLRADNQGLLNLAQAANEFRSKIDLGFARCSGILKELGV